MVAVQVGHRLAILLWLSLLLELNLYFFPTIIFHGLQLFFFFFFSFFILSSDDRMKCIVQLMDFLLKLPNGILSMIQLIMEVPLDLPSCISLSDISGSLSMGGLQLLLQPCNLICCILHPL